MGIEQAAKNAYCLYWIKKKQREQEEGLKRKLSSDSLLSGLAPLCSAFSNSNVRFHPYYLVGWPCIRTVVNILLALEQAVSDPVGEVFQDIVPGS